MIVWILAMACLLLIGFEGVGATRGARLLARFQTSKLRGELTRARATLHVYRDAELSHRTCAERLQDEVRHLRRAADTSREASVSMAQMLKEAASRADAAERRVAELEATLREISANAG